MLIRLFQGTKTKINSIRGSIERRDPSILGTRVATKIFLLEITLSFLKYLVVLFKKPSQSFKILVNQPALDDCVYSYTDHKVFQKKLRVFSMAGFTTVIAATIISTLVLNLTTGPIFQSRAATYSWAQTSWAGGATANKAAHASNQTGWTQYSEADANISAVNSGADLQLANQSGTWTVTNDGTTDTGFNNTGATASSTTVSGTGDSAGVVLQNTGGADANTKLHLHANGANGSTTFTDSSSNNYTVTPGADAKISTAQYKFGSSSALFDGTGDYLSLADSDDWNFGTGDMTLDFWVRFNTISGTSITLFEQELNNGSRWAFNYIPVPTSGALRIYSSITSEYYDFAWVPSTDTWYHVAFVNTSGSFKAFVDGTQVGTSNPEFNLPDINATLGIGRSTFASTLDGALNGYLDEIRVSKGIARWTTNFTPPANEYGSYVSSGTFTSHVYNTTASSTWGTLSWTATTPTGTSIAIKARSGNQSNLSDATAWDSCSNITSGNALSTGSCVTNGHQYIQFQAALSTSDTSVTSTLSDISLAYTNYPTSQTLTSSSYNTSSSGNVISRLSWNEDSSLPAGTTVQLQLRTAPDSASSPGTWTSFLGPDGTSGTYFSNSGTGCTKASTTVTCTTIPSAFTSGSNDQWISYKVYLGSTGLNTPTFSDVTMQYVVNAPPDFDTSFNTTGVTATQNSDGTVTIQYRVRDSDTTSGTTTQGYVTPSFEYSTNGGSTYAAITTTYLASTDLENKAVQEGTYTTYGATWSPRAHLGSSTYVTNAKIRVTINDNEAANNTANAATANFTLDTTSPTSGSVVVNPNSATPGTTTLTISASDNSSMQMKVGLTSDLSDGSWETYGTSKTITLATDPDTVYIQFKDAYNNSTSIISATTPETPSGLMVQDTSNYLVTPSEYRMFVAWKVVATPNPGFGQYNVLRSTDNSTFTQVATITDIDTNYYGDSTITQSQSYYYKVTSQDSNGNISFFSSTIQAQPDGLQNLDEGGGGTDGTGPTISSVSVSNLQTTQATITWTTNEVSNSTVGFSTDTSFTTEQGVASYVTSHSVTLIGLVPNTAYKFQVKSTDATSNLTTDNNSGSGYTFTTLDGPRIVNVSTEDISNTGGKIVWHTDADSNSFVVYSANSDLSSSTETGSSSLVGGSGSDYYHAVTLSSLSRNTTYYFYVKSTDSENNIAINNNGLNYYTFKTTDDSTSPAVSNITVSVTTPDTVIVTWNTNEPATSQVQYGTSTSYGSETTVDSDLDLTHVVPITQLTPNTAYNFAVKVADASGNQTTSDNQTFTTGEESEIRADQTSPTISNITTASITGSSATVTFTTDESCTGTINYGTTTSYGSVMGGNGSSSATSHSIILVGLSSSTDYNFRVDCRDSSNNVGSSSNQTFSTIASTSSGSDQTGPVISSITSSSITSDSAVVTFTSDESCIGTVNYGATSSYDKAVGEITTATSHSLKLSGLSSSTAYHFLGSCRDTSNNVGYSSDQTFTTLAPTATNTEGKTETEKRVGTLIDEKFAPEDIQNAIKKLQTPPSITGEGPQVSDIYSTSAKIKWNTDKKSNSVVLYSSNRDTVSNNLGDIEGNDQEQTLTHEITLRQLIPGTTYYFKSKSQDIYGNITTSEIKSFMTLVVPMIANVAIEDITLSSAVITWDTSVISTGYVEYGKDTSYGTLRQYDDANTRATSHILALTNLEATTTYHFRIKGVASTDSSLISSEDYTFNTQALPIISGEAIKKISDNSAKINFETNIPTDTQIFYKPIGVAYEYYQKGKADLVKTHEIVVDNLEFGTAYDILIKAKDAYDNKTEKQLATFTTGVDLEPPAISLLRTENALIPGKKNQIQTIISWKTDEPSATQVHFQEGIDVSRKELENKTQEDKNLTKDHVVVLTNLKPGTVYQLRAVSRDNQNNIGTSKDQTMLTPKQQESVFQVIMRNLEEAFGWVKKVR